MRDAQTLRRMRRIVREAKTSALLAALSVYLLLMLVGSGSLDRVLLGSTRFKLLSVSARQLVAAPGLPEALAAVVIDEQTVRVLRDESRAGKRLGDVGSNWRVLHAEALQRLVTAGAKAVVIDFDFVSLDPNDALGEQGSNELAAAILRARRAGTAVVIAGHPNTHPALRTALRARPPPGSSWAAGIEASACMNVATDGTAVFANLLTMQSGRRNAPGLALAGLSGFWRTPDIFVDRPDHQLFLAGEGGSKQLTFAGLGRKLRDAQDCYPSRNGDEPALQVIDVVPRELTRQHNAPRERVGASSIVPFEQVLGDASLDAFKLAGALVLVGKQFQDDRIALAGTERWGMSLHLNAMSDLLRGRAIHPIAPLSQLIWMSFLCACVAWQRLRNRDKAPWLRRSVLLGLVLANLLVVVGCAVVLEVLMDESYQVLAMLVTHVLVGRLDKGATIPAEARAAYRSS